MECLEPHEPSTPQRLKDKVTSHRLWDVLWDQKNNQLELRWRLWSSTSTSGCGKLHWTTPSYRKGLSCGCIHLKSVTDSM